MITDNLALQKLEVSESPKYGKEWKPIKVAKAIVVKKGMENGSPTIDLQCEDKDGNKFIIFMTGNIFRGIAIMAKDEFTDGGASLVH